MRKLNQLSRDNEGAMVIETAFVLPILILLGLGGFEVSQMVAQSTEAQTALAEATAVTLATTPDTQDEIDTIEDIVEKSTGLGENSVTFTKKFRCGTDATLVTDETLCSTGTIVAEFLEITVNQVYTPIWKEIGIGKDVKMGKTQLVQIGQFEAA
jgi:Flp pilus assembly protein TadG